MEVLNARAAMLSNYEVLTLLSELEAERIANDKAAMAAKEAAGPEHNPSPAAPVDTNWRTVEYETLKWLKAPKMATTQQDKNSIARLAKDLRRYDLTKAEKLQIINLMPVDQAALYPIIEDFEDRFDISILEEINRCVQNAMIAPDINYPPAPSSNAGIDSYAPVATVFDEPQYPEDDYYAGEHYEEEFVDEVAYGAPAEAVGDGAIDEDEN
ncbi:hypothetical protein BOTBODRAFT_70673 [Botryobasidium botryosum FD-172 SS1]|uniref:DNA-directed RNA polymerase III subunit RPC9 n=1 Tax=Botryobasidium botryosum (strain FD-172 SS1) TaxID=930990 RepID=A0A067LUG9_BOTB1|nr:hypothetical protein BOTBODRAFT_70673 [Botryobasidium botryosum FD-172 SS1]